MVWSHPVQETDSLVGYDSWQPPKQQQNNGMNYKVSIQEVDDVGSVPLAIADALGHLDGRRPNRIAAGAVHNNAPTS